MAQAIQHTQQEIEFRPPVKIGASDTLWRVGGTRWEGGKKKKTENFYFILRLFSSSFDRNKREKNEEGRVTLGRLLPVNGDIKKRDGQRREKNPKEKKRLFITFMCVWLPSMFLLDKEMDIRRDIFFFLNIPSFSILHFLLKFYLEKKKKWIAPSSPPVSL